MKPNIQSRTVFLGDNLDFLRGINSECVDLIYADPPFNKKKEFTAPIGYTEFRICNIYISDPPSEEKNPPSSGSAYGLGKDSCILCISSCMRFLIEYADGVDG